jgi:cellulose synthase/poly-beta-1,6-N-acetylglucosamine synthase-like glycosyltransferase
MSWRRLLIASLAGVGYVLIGYPVAVIGLSRIFGRDRGRPGDDVELPSVTVVVAAFNEEAVIADRIENLLSSDYPQDRLSVIVAADGSDDDTARIARSFGHPSVSVLAEGPRRGKPAAINRAMREVASDIVVFSDANNRYEADGLTRLVSAFSDPRVGAVTGAKRVMASESQTGAGEGLYWRYESSIKTAESRLGSCVGVNGEMLAVRAGLIDPLPEDTINDDAHMALQVLRSGFDVVYQPDAISWEPATVTVGDDRLRRERIVAGRIQALGRAPSMVPWTRPIVAWQIVSHKLLRPFVPFLAGVALVSTLGALRAAVRNRRGLALPTLALLGQTGIYVAAWVGRHSERPGRVAKTAAYLVDSNRASVGGTIGYLRGRQSVLWAKASRAAEQPRAQAQ